MKFELDNYEMLSRAMDEFCSFLEALNVSEESIFNSKLVTSELVSNVFQHSEGSAFLSGELEQDKICIRVKGTKDFRPPEKSTCSDVYAESGRGLYLVDSVSEERTYLGDGAIRVVIKAHFKK